MATTFTVTRNGATLDLNDGVNFELVSYSPKQDGNDTAVINVLAANITALNDALIVLGQYKSGAQMDADSRTQSLLKTPTLFNYKPDGATNALRSPLYSLEWVRPNDFKIDTDSNGKKRYMQLALTIRRAPYFEESAITQLVAAVSKSNVGASVTIAAANMRGDKPAPLIVEVYTGTGSMDKVVVFVRQGVTIANHYVWLEADTGAGGGLYTPAVGTDTAFLTDANLSNGKGARITPIDSTNKLRFTWTLPATNLIDLYGYKRLLVRGRNNHGSNANAFLMQGRFFVANGGTVGGYSDYTPLRAPSVVGGTTQLPIFELGALKFPSQDVGGAVLQGAGIELWGKSTLGSGWTTFDIDGIFLADAWGGHKSGWQMAQVPQALASAARVILNASDAQGEASVYQTDASGNVLFGGQAQRGQPLFIQPNQDAVLYALTLGANNVHHLSTNTVKVSARFRYSLVRGV